MLITFFNFSLCHDVHLKVIDTPERAPAVADISADGGVEEFLGVPLCIRLQDEGTWFDGPNAEGVVADQAPVESTRPACGLAVLGCFGDFVEGDEIVRANW